MLSSRAWPHCVVLLFPILLGDCAGTTDLPNSTPHEPNSEPQADLSPGPIEAPHSVRLDELLEMRVGVENSGNRTVGPGWVVRVFLSPDAVIDPTDAQIDQFVTTRELQSGASDSYLRNKKLNRNIVPGTYYIGSVLDVTDVVPESAEDNNSQANPIAITIAPETPEP